jgi:hypothetical protein
MDRIGLQTLRAEMLADGRIMQDASAKARERFALNNQIAYEACGHQLCRLYNAFEQGGLRLAKAFENHIDDERGWHATLLNRLSLEIEGVRPALLPQELKVAMTELHGFRHVFVHAYDLELNRQKLQPLLEHAERVAVLFPNLVEAFVAAVDKQLLAVPE